MSRNTNNRSSMPDSSLKDANEYIYIKKSGYLIPQLRNILMTIYMK